MLIATVLGVVEIGVRLRCRNEKTYRLNTDLAQREKLEEHHLEEIDLPNKLFTETMIKDKEMVIGRYVRLGHTLYRGKILDRRDLNILMKLRRRRYCCWNPEKYCLVRKRRW